MIFYSSKKYYAFITAETHWPNTYPTNRKMLSHEERERQASNYSSAKKMVQPVLAVLAKTKNVVLQHVRPYFLNTHYFPRHNISLPILVLVKKIYQTFGKRQRSKIISTNAFWDSYYQYFITTKKKKQKQKKDRSRIIACC